MVSSSPAFSAGHDGSGVLANHDREIGDNRDIDDSLGRPGCHIALRVSWKTNDSTRALALTIAEVRPYAASLSSNRINICNRVARKEKLRCDNKDFRCRGTIGGVCIIGPPANNPGKSSNLRTLPRN